MNTSTSPSRRWPVLAWVLGSLLIVYYLLPLGGLFATQSPAEMLRQAQRPVLVQATVASLATSGVAVLVSLVLGLPLAYALARTRGGWRRAGMVLATLPLVLPPVVSGLLLYGFLGPEAPVGAFLVEHGGLGVRAFVAVVGAQVLVGSPFVVLIGQAALEGVRPVYAQAARTLGGGRWGTFWRVTFPLAWPGILAGGMLCFARAVGEFGATLVVAGQAHTLPLQGWADFTEGGLSRALPVAALLTALVLVVLLLLNALGTFPWRR